jgi:biopolymer transport protein ExbB/TolQ
LRLRINNYIAIVCHFANTLVFLGLVGTVIGFIVALSGVNPELSATVDNVAPMVATLIKGMSIALYTTLIGSVLHVWLMMNYRILATGTLHLFNTIVELGEHGVGRR